MTPRSVIEKFAAVQLDRHIATTDGQELVLTRYTQPELERCCCNNSRSIGPPSA